MSDGRKRTGWYPAWTMKPARSGWYECRYAENPESIEMLLFDRPSQRWFADDDFFSSRRLSTFAPWIGDQWRGLAEKPE